MSARTKLNIAFFNGALIAAGILGGVAGSWTVFFVTLAMVTATAIYGHDIRVRRNSSDQNNRRDRSRHQQLPNR